MHDVTTVLEVISNNINISNNENIAMDVEESNKSDICTNNV